jgi:hypothetical protein
MKWAFFRISQICFTIITFFVAFGILGCATVFKPSTRILLDDSQIEKVQYYVSTQIILTRELTTGEGPEVSSGKVSVFRGKRIEQIIITAKTPGVLINKRDGQTENGSDYEIFDICFERDDNKFISFLKDDRRQKFVMMSNGTTWPKTVYGDAEYTVTYSGDERPYLLGHIKSKYRETKDVRRVQGRRVN